MTGVIKLFLLILLLHCASFGFPNKMEMLEQSQFLNDVVVFGKRTLGGIGADQMLDGNLGERGQQAKIFSRRQALARLPIPPS